MRVALIHPTYWPEVRRGGERMVGGLARYLRSAGVDVTVVTGHRGARAATDEQGVRVVRTWRPPARLQPRAMEPFANHAPLVLPELLAGSYDLVHAFHLPDAYAAIIWSRLARRPLVTSLTGLPDRRSVAAFRGRTRMLSAVGRRARALHVLSESAALALAESTGLEATVIPPGTHVAEFSAHEPRAVDPVILCAASPDDPRKRVADLLPAFALLRNSVPRARLQITYGEGVGPRPDGLAAPGVELVDPRAPGAGGLPAAYARAWVSVLPSEREAFGQVLVESLAAGRPAVGMADGAGPEILDDPGVGVLCSDRGAEALAEALRRGLELAKQPGIAARCVAHARRWDWGAVGPRYETLYDDARPT